MKKETFWYLTALLLSAFFSARAQVSAPSAYQADTSFQSLMEHFKSIHRFRRDTLTLPAIYATEQYKVVLSDSAWKYPKQKKAFSNPFSADTYPLSYSVLYQNKLISLWKPGYFTCYTIGTWEHNLTLEKQLNTRRFERHWLIGGQLIGLSKKHYWQFSPKTGWQVYTDRVPFKNRPKLFEDATYLVYDECNGEFGGRIFFFHRQTGKTYWTPATCAVWVRSTPRGYEILSNLGHGMGSAGKQLVNDPTTLPEWTGKPDSNNEANNQFQEPQTLFSFHSVQLFGGVEQKGQVVYLVHMTGRTYLATLSGRTFTVVDPLFNDRLYTHNPVTTIYGETTVINLDFYGLGGQREVACLVLANDQITQAVWVPK